MPSIRISILVAGLVCCLTRGGVAQEMSPQAQELVQRAVAAQSSGQNGEAAELYRQVLRLQPNDVATHVNLGVVLVASGQYDEGIAQYRQADDLLPGDKRIRLNLALAYEKSGRLEEAERVFAQLHESEPSDQRYRMLLADCDGQLGKDEAVIALLQPLREAGNTDGSVAYMLGTALLHAGRSAEAERVLDPILQNPNTAEAQFVLGLTAFESGQYSPAIDHLRKAIALNPTLPQVNSFCGRALLNTGDSDGAADAFRSELKNNANDYWANLSLGQILVFRQDYAGALPSLERSYLQRPQSFDVLVSYAQALAGVGRFGEARPIAERAVIANENSIEAHRSLQAIYMVLHLRAQADAEGKKWVRLFATAQKRTDHPQVHEAAPDFALSRAQEGAGVRLSDYRGRSPVVLVFGSYSCPQLRSAVPALIKMEQEYRSEIPFFLVYVREAHGGSQWQSTRNSGDAAMMADATTLAEKQGNAVLCSRKLHLPFPALVDGMDGAVEKAYQAWPSRVVVVGSDGAVEYNSRLSDLQFQPVEMEQALRRLVRVPSKRAAVNHP